MRPWNLMGGTRRCISNCLVNGKNRSTCNNKINGEIYENLLSV